MDENDELADKLAQHFKPDNCVVFGERGEVDTHRPANGGDSTMIVFVDTDGHNSMRALTVNEIAEAVKKVTNDD